MNNVGVNIDPWGPPLLIGNHLDLIPCISMKPLRFTSHDSIQFRYERGIPILLSLAMHPTIHNLSEADLKSTNTVLTGDQK